MLPGTGGGLQWHQLGTLKAWVFLALLLPKSPRVLYLTEV